MGRPDETASITILKGISEARASAFRSMGIETLADLIRHYPRDYEERGHIIPLTEAREDEAAAFLLTVATPPKVTTIRKGMTLLRFKAFDNSSVCTVTFFNQPYYKSLFTVGSLYRFYGKLDFTGGRFGLSSPKFEAVPGNDKKGADALPAFVPVYPLSGKLTQKLVSDSIDAALKIVYPQVSGAADPNIQSDILPTFIREKYGLAPERYAMYRIHRPADAQSLVAARKRIIFEELLLFALGLSLQNRDRQASVALPMQNISLKPFLDSLPYPLTSAQKRAVTDFRKDMTIGTAPMHRILSGDVGSGKTVCAAAAIYIALRNGYQAAFMAPTEILARQHYSDLQKLFSQYGFECVLLCGATKLSEKSDIRKRLADGSLPLVIGTHALLEKNVRFNRLGLVVTDEQHRFGIRQRAALTKNTPGVHVLAMSATPIPRTLALLLFGTLNISILDELPPGRQKVATYCVDESYRKRLYGFIRKQTEAGRQVYIVCPAVEEAEEEENDQSRRKSAIAYARELKTSVFPDLEIACLHGKMKSTEKETVMNSFAEGKTQILVSTTVIEVGVNVPNATLMIIENAEYFGLSQLHQLRGRVGRGSYQSYCIFISDAKSEEAQERLKIMCSLHDGFQIAEKDLELRGPGDFFSTTGATGMRQSGELHFRLAEPGDGLSHLRNAFAAASEIIQANPHLEGSEFALLRERVAQMSMHTAMLF